MSDYYSKQLSSKRLMQCYEIAPPRVKQYLRAEIDYVLQHVRMSDIVIELGCGYGRVLRELEPSVAKVIGIDTSRASLQAVIEYMGLKPNCHLFQSDAAHLALSDKSVDMVVCIQNGISAFKTDPSHLIKECVRITRRGGICFLSSYADAFWEHRLQWFTLQADEGLIGEIDWSKTSDGTIVCKDGFMATTFRPENFEALCHDLNLEADIVEVDRSAVFCRIQL